MTELRQLAWWETIKPTGYFRQCRIGHELQQVCSSAGSTVEEAFYFYKERGITILFFRPISS
jgi:hypothetical protein